VSNIKEYTKTKLRAIGDELRSLSGLVLDVGCSGGYSRKFMGDVRYIGVDITFDASQEKGQNFIVASATNLPFVDECFDAILFLDVIEHIPPPEDVESLKEIARTLVHNGRVILSTPNMDTFFHREDFLGNGHINCMKPHVLKQKLSMVNFQILKRIPCDIFVIPPHRCFSEFPIRLRRILAKWFSRLDKYQIYEIRKRSAPTFCKRAS